MNPSHLGGGRRGDGKDAEDVKCDKLYVHRGGAGRSEIGLDGVEERKGFPVGGSKPTRVDGLIDGTER